MLIGVIILILVTVLTLRIGHIAGYFIKQPVSYSPSDRAKWAVVCGFFPAIAGITSGNHAFIVLGVAIGVIVYSRPQYYRYRWRRAAR